MTPDEAPGASGARSTTPWSDALPALRTIVPTPWRVRSVVDSPVGPVRAGSASKRRSLEIANHYRSAIRAENGNLLESLTLQSLAVRGQQCSSGEQGRSPGANF